MKRPEENRSAPILHVAGIGIAVFLSVVVAAVAVAEANSVMPRLGDIVSFRPGTEIPGLLRVEIPAQHVDRDGRPMWRCVLEPEVMAARGGSIVVEAELSRSGRSDYLVHWAGAATSSGSRDCGERADLVLSQSDVESLARTAGGFGVNQQGPLALIGAPPAAQLVTN